MTKRIISLFFSLLIALAMPPSGSQALAGSCLHASTAHFTHTSYEQIAEDASEHKLALWLRTVCRDCEEILSDKQLLTTEQSHRFPDDGSVLTCEWCKYQTSEDSAQTASVPSSLTHYMLILMEGQSMADTLEDGEILLVSQAEYLQSDPQFGDVVVCRYPGRTENFVKRVMGLPGDEIMIISNIVFRNGEMISEPYLTTERNDNGFTMVPFKLGENEYFVMGDNRDNSHDSRNYYSWDKPAALTRDMITGKVLRVIFPLGGIRTVEHARQPEKPYK